MPYTKAQNLQKQVSRKMSLFYVNTITAATNKFIKTIIFDINTTETASKESRKTRNLSRTAVNNVIAARCFSFRIKQLVCVTVHTKIHRFHRKWVCVIVNTENIRFSSKSSIFVENPEKIQEFHQMFDINTIETASKITQNIQSVPYCR